MKVLHSVRTRIIVISLALLLLFMIAYTVTIWTLADSYALMNTSQNNAFSLSLVSQEISGNLDDVRALVTRVATSSKASWHTRTPTVWTTTTTRSRT